MIVYFLIQAGNPSACVLILQPQSNKMKVLKFGSEGNQQDFVKTRVVNSHEKSQLHLITRNKSNAIIHHIFDIKNARSIEYQYKEVCQIPFDIGGVFLSKNVRTITVIFTGFPIPENEGDTCFYQYQWDKNNGSDPFWKHVEKNGKGFFNLNDIKNNNNSKLIDQIATRFLAIAKGYRIDIDSSLNKDLRNLFLKQLKEEEYQDDTTFQMIAYNRKFVIYKSNSSKDVFFLNDNFQINAIINLKKKIKKIIALNSKSPFELQYIYNDFIREP